jgi:hypothetical protein
MSLLDRICHYEEIVQEINEGSAEYTAEEKQEYTDKLTELHEEFFG